MYCRFRSRRCWFTLSIYALRVPLFLMLFSFVAHTQSASRRNWEELVDASPVIAIVSAGQESWIVRKDKMVVRSYPQPNGKILLQVPWPQDYLAGRLIRLQIDEVLQTTSEVTAKDTLTVYVSGWYFGENSPIFMDGCQYLVFLKPLKAKAADFMGLSVVPAKEALAEGTPVDPSRLYEVVDGRNGMVMVNEKNLPLIDAAKQAIHRRK